MRFSTPERLDRYRRGGWWFRPLLEEIDALRAELFKASARQQDWESAHQAMTERAGYVEGEVDALRGELAAVEQSLREALYKAQARAERAEKDLKATREALKKEKRAIEALWAEHVVLKDKLGMYQEGWQKHE